MNPSPGGSGIDGRFRVMVIIWWALMVSVLFYAVVAHVVRFGLAESAFVKPLALALAAVTAVELGIQRYFFSLLVDRKLFPGTADPARSQVASRGRDFGALPPEERAPLLILSARTTLGIIIWALGESIVIYGLMLALISGNPLYLYPFLLVGAGSMVWYRPRRSDFDEQMERWRRWRSAGSPSQF